MEINSKEHVKSGLALKQRSYVDIVEYLDAHWSVARQPSLERVKVLDQALQNPSKALRAIVVAGSNGKSLTINFAARLLSVEGLKVGAYYAPHLVTYQERFVINTQIIAQKTFVDIANEVINAAEQARIEANTAELLAVMAFCYFKQERVDVALLEADLGGLTNPVNICQSVIAVITRIAASQVTMTPQELSACVQETAGIIKPGTYIVSGDQNKATLHALEEYTTQQGGHWLMPIRKVVALNYPFEQLHGRCAALAERIALTYVTHFMAETPAETDTLLVKQKIQRGRPTVEAKRQQELNPRKTVEQFWKELVIDVPGRFQLLAKESPAVLLDNARNFDAFENLLLGIRLLNYSRPFKGLSLVIGAAQDTLHSQEFVKLIRYFFKKTSGQLFVCPINEQVKGVGEAVSWDVQQVTLDMKKLKIKAKACKDFEEAFDLAHKAVDERHGMVVIAGSHALLNEYENLKNRKKA